MATTPVQAIAAGAVADFDLVKEALSAEYEVLEELGRGGMALVYRAKDRSLEREVAIKVLPFSLAFDAEFVERFQREARTAGQLEHPHIIPIYRVGRAGRVIYFVMKYLRGGSLSGLLGERGKLSAPEIRRVLVEAGSALGHAAQRGIVHRDIKPDNIMFDEFGHTVLTDFGIAKAASGQKLTGTGMSIGTPHYMSPEQARAQPIDGRSDIYSLGVVAYQALTGAVPYDGEDSFSIGYKHITEPIPTPPLGGADERKLFEVVRRMLMKDPADRFQSCEELIAALQGQPMAPAAPSLARTGALTGVGAAGAMAFADAPTAPAPAIGALPNQATTPINASAADRRAVLTERRARPRRHADRGSSRHRRGVAPAWLWLLLAVGGGGAGAVYYYNFRGFAPATVAADTGSAATPPGPAAGPLATADSLLQRDSGAVGATVPRTATESGGAADSAASPCEPGERYDATRCFDRRPRPVEPTFVPAPAGSVATPAPSVLWVRVSADGRTLEVRPLEPSADTAFERAARAFAERVRWQPARRADSAVDAWMQWKFDPAPR